MLTRCCTCAKKNDRNAAKPSQVVRDAWRGKGLGRSPGRERPGGGVCEWVRERPGGGDGCQKGLYCTTWDESRAANEGIKGGEIRAGDCWSQQGGNVLYCCVVLCGVLSCDHLGKTVRFVVSRKRGRAPCSLHGVEGLGGLDVRACKARYGISRWAKWVPGQRAGSEGGGWCAWM